MSSAMRGDEWAREKLEHLGMCPVCSSRERAILLDSLIDDTFRVAPGSWTLWQCASCGNAYLDPRPDRSSIGEAYASYYTHAEPLTVTSRTPLARLRQAVGNGYRNKRFGVSLTPAVSAGAFVAKLLTSARRRIDIEYRFLPGPGLGRRSVLDIGCGNGSWLELARQAGWRVYGVEPDSVAAEIAEASGIEVRRDLEEFVAHAIRFDHITLSHVIEHVHDPRKLLRCCYEVLTPGGMLYIQTPNVGALGMKTYGRFWRGLEAPRHLVLFSVPGLFRLLCDVGFVEIIFHPSPDAWEMLATASERLKMGERPDDASVRIDRHTRVPRRGLVCPWPPRSEFITFTCRRPCER